MPEKLTGSQIRDFQSHVVWQELLLRIEKAKQAALDRAIDDSDARMAGYFRALEMVEGLPDTLLQEIEGGGMVSRIKRVIR